MPRQTKQTRKFLRAVKGKEGQHTLFVGRRTSDQISRGSSCPAAELASAQENAIQLLFPRDAYELGSVRKTQTQNVHTSGAGPFEECFCRHNEYRNIGVAWIFVAHPGNNFSGRR